MPKRRQLFDSLKTFCKCSGSSWNRSRSGHHAQSSSDEREEITGQSTRNKPEADWTTTSRPRINSALSHSTAEQTAGLSGLTTYTIQRIYYQFRTEQCNLDELQRWDVPSIQTIHEISADLDYYETIQTLVRRGVPDGLKGLVIRHAQGTSKFLQYNRGYAERVFKQVFGSKQPSAEHSQLPTFSQGFLGVEKELRKKDENDGNDQDDSQEKVAWVVSGPTDNELRRHLSRHLSFTHYENRTGWKTSFDQTPHHLSDQTRRITDDRNALELAFSSGSPATTFKSSHFRSISGLTEALQTRPFNPEEGMFTPQARIHHAEEDPGVAPPRLMAMSSFGATEAETLESTVIFSSALTSEGKHSARKILWAINHQYPQIEFAPLLVPLTCILLFYVSEEEALAVLMRMLEKSKEILKMNGSRAFMTFRRSEFIRVVKQAYAVAQKHLPKVCAHLEMLKVDLPAWIAHAMQDGFTRVLPFDLVLRIFIPFLFEGSKVFLRYAIALLKIEKDRLLSCSTSDEANRVLLFREYRGASQDMQNELTKLAYRTKIKAAHDPLYTYCSKEVPTPYLTSTQLRRLCRPRLHHTSDIVEDTMWLNLWRWLPHHCKILDPHLAFTMSKDGHSWKAMQRVLWDAADCPILFLIKTVSDEIIGGYLPFAFRKDAHVVAETVDISGSFLCTLKPAAAGYFWTGLTTNLMKVTAEYIYIGVEGPALAMDLDLNRGHSAPSVAFNSPSLVMSMDGDFSIDKLEVWLLE